MIKYRILGLDDDNHSPVFVSEGGYGHYNSYKELIEFLSRPHQYEVEVKMFAIVDGWSTELLKYEEGQVECMFDALAGVGSYPDYISPNDCFNLFWESTNRNFW